MPVRNHEPRSEFEFPLLALWSGVTLTYGAFLAWRWTLTGDPPGLKSIAGMSSIAAVWMYASVSRGWATTQRSQPRRPSWGELSLLLVLATAILTNAIGIGRSVAVSKAYPVVPAVATLWLLSVLRHVLRQISSRSNRSNADPSSDSRIA
jgi:hypothetical protein